MNPLKWFRNWRIRRIEARIAYLERYCDCFNMKGGTPYNVVLYHGLHEKRAKIAELRKRIYHLMEF